MYKLIQRNSKKLLAVFAVGLMIVFILPTAFRRHGMENPVIGTMGEEGDVELHAEQLRMAHDEFELLARYVSLPRPNQNVSILRGYFSPFALNQIDQHPEMYLLLQQEARRMGINPDIDQVETIMRNQVQLGPANRHLAGEIRQAVENFVRVIGAYSRAASTVKVSQPLRRYAVAEEWQQIKVDLVEFRAGDFAADVPAPTEQQLREQYEKYKDVEPAAESAVAVEREDGGRFGYRLPDRVKIQSIEIPINAVRQVVESRRSDYEWEVEAYKYYSKNPKEFPSTQPASQGAQQNTAAESAASGLTLGATTRPSSAAATTAPTTRPFDEVRRDIVDRLVTAETQKLALAIQAQLQAMLANDFVARQQQQQRQQQPASTAPSAGGAANSTFESHEYLQKLAAAIEKQFGVLPIVTTRADTFLGAQELSKLPGISNSSANQTPFAEMVMSRAASALAPSSQPAAANRSQRFELYQPSPALTDFAGNVYFFRVTDAQPAHPAPFEEVAQQVERDWREMQAIKKARAAAESLMQSARESGGLASAAKQAGRGLVTTGAFVNRPGANVPNYALPADSSASFLFQAFELLTEAQADGGSGGSDHPMRIISLPGTQRVIVAQLNEVEPIWDQQSYAVFDLRTGQELSRVYEQAFQSDWYAYDNVKRRLNYQSREREGAEQRPAQPSAPSAPPPGQQPLL